MRSSPGPRPSLSSAHGRRLAQLAAHVVGGGTSASSPSTVDFSRSFLTFRIDMSKKASLTSGHSARPGEEMATTVNNARIPMECIADVTHATTGAKQRIVMGASCKTEACFVPNDIWRGAADGLSADFVPIGSIDADRWLTVKTYDTIGKSVPISAGPQTGQPQPDRQLEKASEALDTLRLDIAPQSATEMTNAAQAVSAGLCNRVFVCRTEYETPDGAYRVALTYPCKTINLNDREMIWQPDTGPVLFFPTLSAAVAPADVVSVAELAFVAFNSNHPGFAEFLVRHFVRKSHTSKSHTSKSHTGSVCRYGHPQKPRRVCLRSTTLKACESSLPTTPFLHSTDTPVGHSWPTSQHCDNSKPRSARTE